MAPSERTRAARPWWRVALTAVLTVLLVAGEFLLLQAVYHRGDDVREQRVVHAALQGALESATGDEDAAWSDRARAQVEGLAAAGLAADDVEALERAVDDVADGRVAAGREAGREVGAGLAARSERVDGQAAAVYVVLLVVVSIGWFFWFRRLVARHRALQQRVTEQEASAVGERRLLALVQNGTDLVMVLDAGGGATFVSPSSRVVLGLAPEEVLGRSVPDLLVADDAPALVAALSRLGPGEVGQVQTRVQDADRGVRVLEGTLTNLLDEPAVGGLVLSLRDVTERHALQERLAHQAFYDGLTGLANRQLFTDRLEHALALGREVAVLFCDLDDFKTVNDSLGHGAGDALLATVGERLRDAVRPGDTTARLGGDEFAVLLEDTDPATAAELATALVDAMSRPARAGDTTVPLQLSIGVATTAGSGRDGAGLLRDADLAMYRAKSSGKALGRSTVVAYEESMHVDAVRRLELRSELHRALDEDQLVLHFQPTVDIRGGAVTGVEALVRWQHPERGLVPPGEFVPLAEQTGLIGRLGSWVLREACRVGAELQEHGPLTVSVNVAAQQLLQPAFVQEVLGVLAATGLPPQRLVVELTESVLVGDLSSAAPRLAALREHGVRVAIDDFGTGYSSLQYLSDLPVDVLKVDKSFVDQVTSPDGGGASITETVIEMGRRLGLVVVAEGVEQVEQHEWLRRASCDLGQGYLWSRPVPASELASLIRGPGPGVPAPRTARGGVPA
ncbi:EAL domain-containing protein [Angustibacter speluncae]